MPVRSSEEEHIKALFTALPRALQIEAIRQLLATLVAPIGPVQADPTPPARRSLPTPL
jgi:hypothetical protein